VGLFSIEHEAFAQRADFAAYGAAAVGLGLFLGFASPRAHAWVAVLALALGWLAWGGIEYGLHRFVLHGLPPFSHWHAEHHRRPAALLGTPTVVSLLLFGVLVYLPAYLLAGATAAAAFTLGSVIGYLGYATAHHAVHHWHGSSAWLARQKRWHALHHHRPNEGICFGVTLQGWDRLFHTSPKAKPLVQPAG
jgi:cyclopropane-fatty-acyl-phospholipid synthase